MAGVGSVEFLLDWLIVAVSVFNTMLLLWLGISVLLNSERRTLWHLMAGGGLLLAAAIFALHVGLLGRGLGYVGVWLNLWWRVGWVPALLAPYAWYTGMLWYAGYWEDHASRFSRRQRPWLLLVTALMLALAAIFITADLLPAISRNAARVLESIPLLAQVPLRGVLYPPYIILCIGLSLDALRRPGPSVRVMGEFARRRARPWLIATGAVLLLISLLVAAGMLWFVGDLRSQLLYEIDRGVPLATAWYDTINGISGIPYSLAWLDLMLATLVAVAVLLLGQAVASYEVFTGRTLPRRGLLRQWRSTVLLAAGVSIASGFTLIPGSHPIYTLLFSVVLLTIFYALTNWRSFAERDRYMSQLRPFVAGPRLYSDLLAGPGDGGPGVDVESTFRALCADVLNTSRAYLAAVGPLSSLAGPPLIYPHGTSAPAVLPDLRFDSPGTMAVPVDPDGYAGAEWAVPLWSERGLIGVLLLGEKRDGGLYSQEEIEIARATGERIIDTKASAEMAGRLMALQRQRLAESALLDRRSRRVLHDDALPRLHAAMLMLSSGSDSKATSEGLLMLTEVHRQISDLLRDMPHTTTPEVSRLGLLGALRQAVEGELAGAFDRVSWDLTPEGEKAAAEVQPLAAEVVFYAAREAIRNAARHGRHGDLSRPLRLYIALTCGEGGLQIAVEDDGAGVSGDGRTEGGSGQGLALHSTMMAVVGGSLAVSSVPGRYTRVTLVLPDAVLSKV